ncbi:MAG: endonuclease [Bacteroidetes bacterium]|nr:MAG: endonuclease [Bacteroidota bacterium]
MKQSLLGVKGEQIAAAYLTQEKSFVILERNYRFGHLEVDLICQDRDYLVIVEVKTRDYTSLIHPREAVNAQKQRQLIRAANAYIESRDLDQEVRFDVVSIRFCQPSFQVDHLEDAFGP